MPDIAIPRHVYAPPYIHAGPTAYCNTCGAPADAPQHFTQPVELSDTGRKWLEAIRGYDRQLSAIATTVVAPLAELRDAAMRNLQAEIGDGEAATVGGRPVVVWAYRKPAAGFDLDRFRRDHPDLAATYAKDKRAARPFTVVDEVA